MPLIAVTLLRARPLEMGLIAAAGFLAWPVIGLPAGAIAQRLPLRGTQVLMDAVRAVAVLSVPVAWWWGHLTITYLIVTALVLGFADVLFEVCTATFLPSIVSRDLLQARNSLMSGTYSVTQLGGPTLGGVLVQLLGAVPTLVIDAVSYAASALLLRTLPARRIEAPDAWPPMRAMVREGWNFVVRHPVMGPCLWFATAVNFVCGAQMALFALYLVRELHAPAGLVGLMLATEGAGSLIGAALTPRLTRAAGTARACVAAGIISTAGALVIPAGTGVAAYLLFAAGNIAFAGGVVVFSVSTRTYQQTASPPELLPRVMATVRFVSFGVIPVGSLLGGALAGVVGSRAALLALGALTFLAPLALIMSPVRRQRDLAVQVS
jgi:MFS family permease